MDHDRLKRDPDYREEVNQNKRLKISQIEAEAAEELIEEILGVINGSIPEEFEEEDFGSAWDDVHGGALPAEKVREARNAKVGYMNQRGIWKIVPVSES